MIFFNLDNYRPDIRMQQPPFRQTMLTVSIAHAVRYWAYFSRGSK